jgi:endonuclease III
MDGFDPPNSDKDHCGMAHNLLRDVVALLARHYGTSRTPDASGEWMTLVRIVLDHGKSAKKRRDWSWVTDSSLRTARDAADQTISGLVEVLESARHSGSKAGLLRLLAGWWQSRIGEAEALAVFRSRSLEHWQNELRALSGVSWDLADRILLFVGGLAVYPLDRGSMRIAHRHGWMDGSAEYDDWQSFYVSAARDAGSDLQQLWRWNVQVGRDFCGRHPNCEECPLQRLLPASGPVPLEGEE